jgi:hypothetical protein
MKEPRAGCASWRLYGPVVGRELKGSNLLWVIILGPVVQQEFLASVVRAERIHLVLKFLRETFSSDLDSY